MSDRFITMQEVCERTTFCETWVRKMVNAQKFPAPKKVGQRAIRFLESEVSSWLKNPDYIGNEANQSNPPIPAS
jgi:prophage regulatory protein